MLLLTLGLRAGEESLDEAEDDIFSGNFGTTRLHSDAHLTADDSVGSQVDCMICCYGH